MFTRPREPATEDQDRTSAIRVVPFRADDARRDFRADDARRDFRADDARREY